MYVDQLSTGDGYANLCPAISICLLEGMLFRETPQAHHRFELVDAESGRQLPRAVAVHTVELSKYNLDAATIASADKFHQWVYLLLKAQDHSADELRQLLPGIEFAEAIQTIETIAQKTQDYAMYSDREKALRDYQWAITGSRQEGEAIGFEKGEAIGLERGVLAGRAQLLQELLNETPATTDELRALSNEELTQLVETLQLRLRQRNGA
jgi:predicted transposase/invertase (TIGR01784 family)